MQAGFPWRKVSFQFIDCFIDQDNNKLVRYMLLLMKTCSIVDP